MMPKGRPGSRDKGGKNRISSGVIIEYEHHGNSVLAVVNKPVKKKWLVLDENSKEVSLAVERIYLLPARLPATDWPKGKKVSFLQQLSKKANQKVTSLDMEEVWKKCQASGENSEKAQSISDHTRAVFKSDQVVQHLALRRAFLLDEVFFTRRGQNFQARKEQDVEKRKKEAEKRLEAAEKINTLISAIATRLKDEDTELPEEISLVEDLALWGVKHASAKQAREVLNRCSSEIEGFKLDGKPADQAMLLLEKLGHFKENENLPVIRHRISRVFSEEIMEAVEAIAKIEIDQGSENTASKREDFSGMCCFSIDGVGTQDIDDALSFDSDTGELGIHISDVSERVQPESLLDKLAVSRGSSIYCADESIHMFPDALSCDKLSLKADQLRPAISYIVKLSDNGEVDSFRIVRSIVKVASNLSYELANGELCDGTSDLAPDIKSSLLSLWDMAAKRDAYRIESGATHLDRRDLSPKIDAEGNISLQPVSDDSPAFKLVSEMMILANECSAAFATGHGFPLVFRSQPEPDRTFESVTENTKEGPAREYALRGLLKRSETSVKAASHFGLGVKQYAQTTSPIRRASDLANQQQISNFLKSGEACFDEENLTERISQLEGPSEKAGLVQYERNRYWLLKYIETQGLKELNATIVKVAGPKPLAELELSQTTATFKTDRKDKKIKARNGEKIVLKIDSINSKRGSLRLSEKLA